MNVNLQKLVALLVVLLLPAWQWAQEVWLQTYENTPLTYQFESKPFNPNWNRQPQHGTATLANAGNYMRQLTYTPHTDYVGRDTIRIVRWRQSPATQWVYLTLYIEVLQANVKAYHDYAVTTAGQPVSVDVLANDFSSNGVKTLTVIPVVNNGLAGFNAAAGTVTFTPAPGFSGLAHLNYVLCNGLGDCDEGTLSVSVMSDGPAAQDTIKVFTRKNEAQFILSPPEYTLLDGPDHGIFDPVADVPTYTPDEDYVGLDYLVFDNGLSQTVFEVEVLNLKDNEFAFDDRQYTVANQEITFDVLANDSLGGCWSYGQAQYGTVSAPYPGAPPGLLTYTPAPGFIGVDEFVYMLHPPGCAGPAETAKVYVFVSNFEPDRSVFEMATPKMTPIIIGYNVPVGTFNFSVAQQGDLGTALFLEGIVDTTIYGAAITGENMLIYVPDEGVSSGTDEIEIVYCLMDPQGGCAVSKTVKIYMDILDIGSGEQAACVGSCVWAGDTNFDGIVNMEDLLPIGRAVGKIGKPRADASLDVWYGQYADDWSDLFGAEEAIDLKHIDADGDSIVTAIDTVGINLFYGRTHAMAPRALPFSPFEVNLEGDVFAEPGELVTLKVKIGMPGTPAHNVYGFVLPFNYSPDFFVPESVNISFAPNNWLSYDSPVLHMKRNNLSGLLEAGFTRTSGLAASGYGEIGSVSFVVVDDLGGFRADEDEVLLTVGGGSGIVSGPNGETMQVKINPYQLRIRLRQQEPDPARQEDKLSVYPNPATDWLTIRLKGGEVFESAALYTLTGQRVSQLSGLWTNQAEISVAALPVGMYVLSVTTPSGVINRKVEVMR
jgi:hypothetical protein